MENVNFNHLYYFHVVAESGSLGAAARKLSVTKPTISTQVRQLETFLGKELFDRRGGRLRLNDEGRVAHRHTKTMFEAGRALMSEFREEEEEPKVLRVGVAASVSRNLAADFFEPLKAVEDTFIQIRSGDVTELQRRLSAFEIDLLLTDSAPPNPDELGFGVELLSRVPLVVVAASSMVKPSTTLKELASELPIFHYLSDSRDRWKIDHFLRERGIDVEVAGETDDVSTQVSLAMAGSYFVIVPEESAAAEVESGALTIVERLEGVEFVLYALYLQRDIPGLVKSTIDLLRRLDA